MAEAPQEQREQVRTTQAWTNYVVGLLVFALGIVLMLAAFAWGYQMLQGVDGEVRAVQTAPAADNPAAATGQEPTGKSGAVVVASPRPGGPSLLQVAIGAILKLVILLVLAGIGAMTASRGAQLAGLRVG